MGPPPDRTSVALDVANGGKLPKKPASRPRKKSTTKRTKSSARSTKSSSRSNNSVRTGAQSTQGSKVIRGGARKPPPHVHNLDDGSASSSSSEEEEEPTHKRRRIGVAVRDGSVVGEASDEDDNTTLG